ncbi:hypothetical protein T4C_4512 [Trichinella pseudospiralis]|uniref:Uncharacterized protein n=1 Tax=Trichinella pseudospiralis TaxID=6337 RepID=A0A0V1KGE7_TRIPS|nr:hypothetical protein T4C_4512 [Trichinella pseudospiralis]
MKVAAVFMGGNSPCIARKREVSKSQITVCEPSLYGIVAHYRSDGGGRRAAAIKPPLPPSSKILSAKTAGTPVASDPLGQRIKAPRNKPLIYGKAASWGIVSKTVRRSDYTDPPQCPPAAKSFAHPIGAVKTSRS